MVESNLSSETKSTPTIALIGYKGNLGKAIDIELNKRGFNVVRIGRTGDLGTQNHLTPNESINLQSGLRASAIINLANYYTPAPDGPDFERMKDSIVGVAKAIAQFNKKLRVPLISASTYFQFSPKTEAPWSDYVLYKNQARELLSDRAISDDFTFTDFILFDNYGGERKSKFFDLAVESLNTGSILPATCGEQVVNLAHIEDIVDAIIQELNLLLRNSSTIQNTYELRSSETYSLKELALLIESNSGRSLNINWCAIPYREREVFNLWDTGFSAPPTWIQKWNVSSYIKSLFFSEV